MNAVRTSRCSSGSPVKFRWFGSPLAAQGEDFDVLIGKFELEIGREPRIVNDYIFELAKAEIENRVRRAEQGRLYYPDEIKDVDRLSKAPMFEIRWQGITVLEKTEAGIPREVSLLVRLYHSEPEEVPGYFVGHHLSEKNVLDTSRINEIQNDEIRAARNYYLAGEKNRWGIQVPNIK